MQRELGKDIQDPKSRTAFLMDNCDSVEQKGYMKRFTPEQLLKKKEDLSELAIKINDIEVEKKETVKDFTDTLKPLNEEKKEILKGTDAETLEVETFANVNGRDVAFILLSPAANQTMEDIRDKVIDEQLDKIRLLCPEIAIIEQ
jgi:hypothetical protein